MRIFRRIAGRIVPIRVAANAVDKATQVASTAIKQALKSSASARTNLANKRVAAVNTVRRFVSAKDPSVFGAGGGKAWKQLGRGGNAVTLADPKRPGWAIKTGHGELAYRGDTKAILSKHRLAPETFHVQTKDKDYLVQKIVKPAPGYPHFSDEKGWQGQSRSTTKLENRINRLGITPSDVTRTNKGILKGKLVTIDSGGFEPRRSFSPSEVKRIMKFKISGRNYLAPIDQVKLFGKKGKK